MTNCRACDGELTTFLDLGDQYLSDFRNDNKRPPKYPLKAMLCCDCYLVQLSLNVPQKEMYHKNYGFKSGISDSIKRDLDEIVTEAYQWIPDPKNWLDIASNDGTLLSYVPRDVFRVGVDPVGFLCVEAEAHADLIVNDYFNSESLVVADKFDVITAISCFYDMPDPNQFVLDVKNVLADSGVWIIQQNYLLTTLQLGAVDNFCHEHLTYFTLLSLEPLLERHGLEVVDVSTSMVNGGSIRTVVAHKGKYQALDSVRHQRDLESDADLTSTQTYKDFAENARLNLEQLKGLVDYYRLELGYVIYILAASTRGATLWQSAGIGKGRVSAAVERNPAKVGKLFSAIDVPIISENQAHRDRPDVMLVGPWFFFKPEIARREEEYVRAGGRLVVPLPRLNIIDKDNINDYTRD